MREKILERVYKIVLREIISKIDAPRLRVTLDLGLKNAILSAQKNKIMQRILGIFREEALIKAFREDLFVIDERFKVHKIAAGNVDEAVKATDNLDIRNVVSVVRSWPTIPPHLLATDLLFAAEVGAKSLVMVSRQGNELHFLLMKLKGRWEDCLEIRDVVAKELFEKADTMVPVMSRRSEEIERFDAFNYKGKFVKLYPGITNSAEWKKAINIITEKYLGPIEFPQYFFVRLL